MKNMLKGILEFVKSIMTNMLKVILGFVKSTMKIMEQQLSEKLTISRHETQSSSSVREYSDSIPVDLLIEIFLRVPSKSIARLRCVSKFWGSILRRPEFTELFMTRSPRILFTLEEIDDQADTELLYFSSPQLSNPEENSSVVATPYNPSFPEYAPSGYITVRCGLVFGEGYHPDRRKSVRVICNPATGEVLTLPRIRLKIAKTLPRIKPKIENVCFGYDPINKLFKVLCMTSSKNHRILTLESGKLQWRKIESEFDYRKSNSSLHGEICIDGVLYFGGCYSQQSYGIVCFDVGSEKLSFINIDKDMIKERPTLINYNGKVGIRERRFNKWAEEEDIGFDLWVLEDAGNHKWSKHIHLFPPLWQDLVYRHKLSIIGMTSTGEMVFAPRRLSNPFYIFYYNLETKTSTRVNVRGFEEFSKENDTYDDYYDIETFLDYGENMKLFK